MSKTLLNGFWIINGEDAVEVYERLAKKYDLEELDKPVCRRCGKSTEYTAIAEHDAKTPAQNCGMKLLPFAIDGWRYLPTVRCFRCNAALAGYECATNHPWTFNRDVEAIHGMFLLPDERTEFKRIFLASHDKSVKKVDEEHKKKGKGRYTMRGA